MNLKINQISFRAVYIDTNLSKSTHEKADQYNRAIDSLIALRDTTLKAQEYLESPYVQEKISRLSPIGTLSFYTLDMNNNPSLAELNTYIPYMRYEKPVFDGNKLVGGISSSFNFKLDDNGGINSQAASGWLDRLA